MTSLGRRSVAERRSGGFDLVRRLTEFFAAVGYVTDYDTPIVQAWERSRLHQPLRVLAMRASAVSHVEIRNRKPTHVVVEDNPSADDVMRLREECAAAEAGIEPESISRFMDHLWFAESVAEQAIVD